MMSQGMDLSSERPLPRTHVRRPPVVGSVSLPWKLGRGLVCSALSPAYWLMAMARGAAGLDFRAECARLGLSLLAGPARPPLRTIYDLLFVPIDSTRHFEFDFMWQALRQAPMQ